MIIEVASLLIGTLCVFWGYKLLMRGVYADADAKAVWSDRSLLLRRGAPGVVFALFGATMILMGLLHSSHIRNREASSASGQTATEQMQSGKQMPSTQPPKRKNLREEGARQPFARRKNGQEGQSSGEDADQPPTTKTWKPGRV